MRAIKDIARPGGPRPLDVGHQDQRGRVLVADSMSYYDSRVTAADVLVCGSFAGAHIVEQLGLCWGPRALIAHACGVGKDDAGISGLTVCQELGVPMAAVETMSARISDGRSVFESGVVGHVNEAAQGLGVAIGMSVERASHLMLDAAPGDPIQSHETDTQVHILHEGSGGRIVAVWNPLLLLDQGRHSEDVICIGLHSGKVMAEWSSALEPRGVIANDGGFGKDRTGVAGLDSLGASGVAAASVAAMSARIGDCLSTYADGVITALNDVAHRRGVREGMTSRKAALLMLGA